MSSALLPFALVLTAITMGLSLAHSLEFPGKLRLDEATYRSVQTIYYPGFTIGGLIGEFGGMLVLAVLTVLTPIASEGFWNIAAALGLFLAGHATYWVATHPINSAWLKDTEVSSVSRTFFGVPSPEHADWKQLRKAWEYSHVVRAVLHMLGFVCLTVAALR